MSFTLTALNVLGVVLAAVGPQCEAKTEEPAVCRPVRVVVVSRSFGSDHFRLHRRLEMANHLDERISEIDRDVLAAHRRATRLLELALEEKHQVAQARREMERLRAETRRLRRAESRLTARLRRRFAVSGEVKSAKKAVAQARRAHEKVKKHVLHQLANNPEYLAAQQEKGRAMARLEATPTGDEIASSNRIALVNQLLSLKAPVQQMEEKALRANESYVQSREKRDTAIRALAALREQLAESIDNHPEREAIIEQHQIVPAQLDDAQEQYAALRDRYAVAKQNYRRAANEVTRLERRRYRLMRDRRRLIF